jgi:hypothetical protein|tara:strand:- start:523 stop:879 length:357 start_codon:yes stop_codon:yes gene_type:complete
VNITKLNDTIKSNKFLIETTFQLKKDFLNTGVTFDIEKPIQNYKQLFIFTSSIVNALNIQDPKRIVKLLYRIDLSEEKVQSEMKISSLSFSALLAELIVKRVLQKVIIKNYYLKPENQ